MKRKLFFLIICFLFLSCNRNVVQSSMNNPPNKIPSIILEKKVTDIELQLNDILKDYVLFCDQNDRYTTFEGFIEYLRLRVRSEVKKQIN